jgi:hypothetical protein
VLKVSHVILLGEIIGFSVRIMHNMNTNLEESAQFIIVAACGTDGYRGALKG